MNYFIRFACLLMASVAIGQTPDLLLNPDQHHLIDRLDIQNPSGFTGAKPYNSAEVLERTQLDTSSDSRTTYLRRDNFLSAQVLDSVTYLSKRPILQHFYKQQPHFYAHQSQHFRLAVNPLLSLKIGRDNLSTERLFINTRGIEVKGMIDEKIGFYSMITENQFRMPGYVNDRIGEIEAVPGENFWKAFKETGYDFFTAKGYLNFRPTRSIRVKFGYDKNFIGNGYRSMILSDYAGNYTHLRVDTKVWKLHYTNIFADLTADLVTRPRVGVIDQGNRPLSKKFMTFHRLDWKIRKNLSVGLFESIMFGGDTATGRTFDINFLNPIIFYRAVEGNVGSGSGNAILGTDFKWNFLGRFSVYGQLVIDEFRLERIRARDGWWANKFAGQLGLKYINVAAVDGLDFQLEYNAARPYIYSHTTKRTSYSHFNQSLAHPLGGNFNELLAIVRYVPNDKLLLQAKAFFMAQGLDTAGSNFGSDILKPNTTRFRHNASDTGHQQLQGNLTQTVLLDFGVSYMIGHHVFVDLNLIHRRSRSELGASTTLNYVQTGLRVNLSRRVHEF